MRILTRRQFLKAAGIVGGLSLVGGLSWVSRGQGLEIKWGLLPPLTGPFATLGEKQMQGAVLALEELKAEGGFFEDLEWFIEDTTLKAPIAVSKAEKLIAERGVQFITGTISSSSGLAVREVIDKEKVFFNPTVGANEVTTYDEKCSRYLFRSELMTWQASGALARVTIQMVKEGILPGPRHWLLIPGYAYGFSMRDTWREITKGKLEEVGYSEEPGFGLTEHSAIITEIAAAKVDFLVTCLLGAPLITFMEQAHAAGLIGTKPGQLPVVDPVLHFNVREIGDIAIGHYTTIRYSLLHDTPENKRFIEAFYKRWEDYPENFSHNAYVAIKMMAEGIRDAATIEHGMLLKKLEEEDRYMAPMGVSYFRCIDHQIVRDMGAGKLIKVPEYPFPVEQLIGDMVPGEELIAGIEIKCKAGVCG
jgi:branched-chain amino acid transport system substrate-binding protein